MPAANTRNKKRGGGWRGVGRDGKVDSIMVTVTVRP